MTDTELIRRYASAGAEEAFAELVRRHLDLVHSAALRQCGDHPAIAEDICQLVFTQLARKAPKLTSHPNLAGWLYAATRLASLELKRSESRRVARESAAHAMNSLSTDDDAAYDWSRLRPLIDEALHELPDSDREAILLRFFQRHAYRDIGHRFGISDNAARMRVDRALERLREILRRRGVVSTSTSLATLIGTHAVAAAPTGLAARVIASAVAGATAGPVGALVAAGSRFGKPLVGWAGFGAAALVALMVLMPRLRDGFAARPTPTPAPLPNPAASSDRPSSVDRGPNLADASASANQNGPGIQFSGRVLDAFGNPVPGAIIRWSNGGAPVAPGAPRTDPAPVEVKTDTAGRWVFGGFEATQLLALRGMATHTDFNTAAFTEAPLSAETIRQLRHGSHVLRFKPEQTVHGMIVDADGRAIAGASIRIHAFNFTEDRKGATDADGRFMIERVPVGPMNILVLAAGYAGQSVPGEVSQDMRPVRIELAKSIALRVRVIDTKGQPIANAHAVRDPGPDIPQPDGQGGMVYPNTLPFEGTTGLDGRLVWTDAPAGEHRFTFMAAGHMARLGTKVVADDEEHEVVLTPSLVIHGRVTDAGTGEPIPKFHIAVGFPTRALVQANSAPPEIYVPPENGLTLSCSNGTFRHEITSPLLATDGVPRWMLRFEADGYESVVSAPISADNTETHLDVALRRQDRFQISVVGSDGNPAAGATLGLAVPAARLELHPGTIATLNTEQLPVIHRADDRGAVSLPVNIHATAPLPDDTAVWAAHPTGFGRSTLGELKRSPVLELKAWARLSGRFHLPGIRVVRVGFTDGHRMGIHTRFTAETNEQGDFELDRVPCGEITVEQTMFEDPGNGVPSSSLSVWTNLVAEPGQVLDVTLGSGHSVVGRVLRPGGSAARVDGRLVTVGRSESPIQIALGPEGHFRIDGLRSGTYRLDFVAGDFGAEFGVNPRRSSSPRVSRHFIVPDSAEAEILHLGDIPLVPPTP